MCCLFFYTHCTTLLWYSFWSLGYIKFGKGSFHKAAHVLHRVTAILKESKPVSLTPFSSTQCFPFFPFPQIYSFANNYTCPYLSLTTDNCSPWHIPGSTLSSSISLGERETNKEHHDRSNVSLYLFLGSHVIIPKGSHHYSQFLHSLGWKKIESKALALCKLKKRKTDRKCNISILEITPLSGLDALLKIACPWAIVALVPFSLHPALVFQYQISSNSNISNTKLLQLACIYAVIISLSATFSLQFPQQVQAISVFVVQSSLLNKQIGTLLWSQPWFFIYLVAMWQSSLHLLASPWAVMATLCWRLWNNQKHDPLQCFPCSHAVQDPCSRQMIVHLTARLLVPHTVPAMSCDWFQAFPHLPQIILF